MVRLKGFRRVAVTTAALAFLATTGLAPTTGVAGGTRAPEPTPGSARARLLDASTLDGLHLVHMSNTGRLGKEYTEAQLATAAELYDMFTWQYAGSGVTGFLHARRPNMIVMQYADLTWVGDWDLLPGHKWQPFDWNYVDAHESFFSHSAAAAPWGEKRRIPNPLWGWDAEGKPSPYFGSPHEWQANPFDLDAGHPENLERWVNYYTARVRSLIDSDGMDGVSIDEVMQPYSVPPDGYDPEAWHESLKRALAFIREQLGPDVVLAWNGLTQDAIFRPQDLATGGGRVRPRSLDYLQWADAPVFECFTTCYFPFPEVWPQPVWEELLDLAMEVQRRGGVLLANSKPYDKARMFSLASFYIVKGERAYLCEGGMTEPGGVVAEITWFPEFGVAMGKPLAFGEHIEDYLVAPGRDLGVSGAVGTVYARPYERGVVLANPGEREAVVTLGRSGYQARASGGGAIRPDGALPEGSLTFEPTETVRLGPHDGALVLWELP